MWCLLRRTKADSVIHITLVILHFIEKVMLFIRWTTVVAVIFAWVISASAWAAGGYVHDAVGEVLIASGKGATHPAVKNSAITSNTVISTGDNSHAVLKFEDGQIVVMQANSTFNVREYRFEPKTIGESSIVFSKLKGGLLFITGLIGQRSKKSFQLVTPNATIGVRGTEFMVAMADDTLYGKVLSGSININNAAGKATFDAGQAVLVPSSGSMPVAIPAENLPTGIFSRLEMIQVPPSTPDAPSVASEAPTLPLAGVASVITGSALLNTAVAIAGGAPMSLPGAVTGVAFPSGTAPSIPSAPAPAQSGMAATPANSAAVGDPRLFGRHNFTPDRIGTGEICVFCHTPQGSETQVAATPLWDRTQSPLSEYKAFSSIGSATAQATGSISMACLSCHDGTQAPNVVINTPVNYSDMGIYPKNPDAQYDNGRQYLRDHHPVGMLYGGGGQSEKQPDAPVDALTTFNNVEYDVIAVRKLTSPANATSRDFPFQDLVPGQNQPGLFSKQDFNVAEHSGSGSGTVWWLETRGTGKGRQKADFYLYTRTDTVDGVTINRPYVECASCHDPHSTNPTFLRIPNSGSNVCLTCHAK